MMADERVSQQGVNNSAPGVNGLYGLRDTDNGNSQGDVVDSTYAKNNVKDVSFARIRNMQGTGTTFYYPFTGRSQGY